MFRLALKLIRMYTPRKADSYCIVAMARMTRRMINIYLVLFESNIAYTPTRLLFFVKKYQKERVKKLTQY